MYEVVLYIHSWLRWIILLMAIVVISRSAFSLVAGSKYIGIDARLSVAFLGLFDLQFILGLVLYIALSPITSGAFSNLGVVMKDPVLRFWSVEHILVMFVALVIAHIGNSRRKKTGKDTLKFRAQFIFYLIAFILILSMIPWAEHARLFRGISG